MDPEQHARVKDIFMRASQLSGLARGELLDEQCGGDDQLRHQVESLLKHHAPDTILSASAVTAGGRLGAETPNAELWIGAKLGKYEVTDVLGWGSMGIVLKARDTAIERDVALKVLHPELAVQGSFLKRLRAEAKAVGQLNHPNTLTLHDLSQADDTYYLVMEFAQGGSAADHIESHGAYSILEATRMTIDACRGLSAAHAKGLVHRDVKPANLLLMGDGTVKVSDFGIAKQVFTESPGLTQEGQIVGTPHFMSPEQCVGKTVDHRSDIYSLGATYFALLCGRNPYEESNDLASLIDSHCHSQPPDPRTFNSKIPDACAAIIKRAMATSPDDRYQSMDEMQTDLQAVTKSLSGEDVLLPSHSTPAVKHMRPPYLIAAIALLAVCIVGSIWLAFSSGPFASEKVEINIAYSTEKNEWLEWSVGEFEKTEEGKKVEVNLLGMGSIEAADFVLEGSKQRPIQVWSPASSAYVDKFEKRWQEKHGGSSPIAESENLALSPLVFVIWKDRYDAFIAKYKTLSFETIRQAMAEGDHWAGAEHADWGRFQFGHTDPRKSSSGLLTLVLAAYDFHDKQHDLSVADVRSPEFQQWLAEFERGVVQAGGQATSSTGDLMQQMIQEGPSRYDCLMVYENLVIENVRNAERRWGELHVVYPARSMWNDNPYYILETSQSSDDQRAAATEFLAFLLSEPVQRQAIEHGFRPGNVKVPIRFPDSPFVQLEANGISLDIPQACDPPSAEVLKSLLDAAQTINK